MKKCLVIAPKSVAESVWMQECDKWDHLKDIRCSLIMGTAANRKKALQADADLYIINRENVVWMMEELKGKLPFEMVIIDELSSFKSPSAKRWKVIKKPIQSVKYVLGLTGTPASNGYLDLWGQIYLLDGGERLGRFLGDYRSRFFDVGAHKGNIVYQYNLRIGAKDTINRRLSDICVSMSSEDWLTLPDVITNVVHVTMNPTARKTYDKLKEEFVIPLLQQNDEFKELDPRKPDELAKMTSAIKGDTAAVISSKLLQMANGAVYDDSNCIIPVHNDKLDALNELIESAQGENILLFYNYQHDKYRILDHFPQARVYKGDQEVRDWNAGRIPILLCHPASTAYGLNLQQGGHIIVWFGLNWSLELVQQANKRLHRTGQKNTVFIHYLVTKDTMDERVMKALESKDATQADLLNALKGYLNE